MHHLKVSQIKVNNFKVNYSNHNKLNPFFLENFNLWRLLLMIKSYHHTKISVNFLYRQILNPKSFIQLSKTLPVELIRTHQHWWLHIEFRAIMARKKKLLLCINFKNLCFLSLEKLCDHPKFLTHDVNFTQGKCLS